MLVEQRQSEILERVSTDGAVRVSDLVREFNVSGMTIRRDLSVLAQQGMIVKVHGGATRLPGGNAVEPMFAAKSSLQRPEKRAIARAAATLVNPGDAIGLSAGTTTLALARELYEVPGLTVVTNSIHVAELLHERGVQDQTVVLTGGVRTPSDALVGPVAVQSLQTLNLDTVFLGVHGMDLRSGFSSPNLMETDTDRAFITAARRLVVVADHTKWGLAGISTIAKLEEADTLVTDAAIEDEVRARLEEVIARVIVAGSEPA